MRPLWLISALICLPAFAAEEDRCDGFRYVYMAAPVEAKQSGIVEFQACRQIDNRSSRPQICEKIGEIDTNKIKDETYRASQTLWAYRNGVILGTSCVLFAEIGSFLSQPVSSGFRVFNKVQEKSEELAMVEEVRSGQRQVGMIPLAASKRPGAVPSLCHHLTGKTDPAFQAGARAAIEAVTSYIHQTRALRADARYIMQQQPSERAALYETYKRNIAVTHEAQARALSMTLSGLNALYTYYTSGEVLNVPIGTSDEIAIVSPKFCVPAPKIEELRKSVQLMNDLISAGKLFLTQSGLSVPDNLPEPLRSRIPAASVPAPGAQPAPPVPEGHEEPAL